MVLFPPGKGGGEGVAHGYKGKGVLIHVYTDANGMPLSVSVTPANTDERSQVEPLIDGVKVRTRRRGRPRKRVRILAADKGYDSDKLRANLRKRGILPKFPKRRRPGGKSRPGRPIRSTVPRFKVERLFAWLQRKYRRIVVRWERLQPCFLGFVLLAVCHLWATRLFAG